MRRTSGGTCYAADQQGPDRQLLLERGASGRGGKSAAGFVLKTTLDAFAALHRAVAELEIGEELLQQVKARSSRYLNNVIEQEQLREAMALANDGDEELQKCCSHIRGIEIKKCLFQVVSQFCFLGC